MNKRLQRKLDKLLALAGSSNEHEASNAMSRLEKMCVANGVDIATILDQDEATERYWFRYDNPYVKTLLNQVAYMINPDSVAWQSRGKQRQRGYDLTKSQKAEFDLYYSIMRAKLKEHLELSVSAFIQANNLFPETSDTDYDPSDIDWERYDKIEALAQGIDKTHVHKAIGG